MTRPITDRQKEILFFLAIRIQSGLPPTNRDIREAFGFRSANGVHEHLVALQKKGLIERQPTLARAVRVTPKGMRALSMEVA